MFNLIDGVIKLIVVIPIMILIAYIFGAFCHSFFGGPIWLWIAGLLILGTFAIKGDFEKNKANKEQEAK
jgi:hypothetical protein